ncbi:type IV pilin [Methanolobus vulcani]|nr:type IV pilin N-terminal domain-containing protein [Methanolobus vulcani]
MKMLKQNSEAVSPVIGVMLMLVVTVILAAAVSSTSTGLIKSSDPAPTAVFTVEVAKGEPLFYGSLEVPNPADWISIKEITGDAIDTKNLKIVTTNYNATGTMVREIVAGETISYAGSTYTGTVPFNNQGNHLFGNPENAFGNYTVKPGVTMYAIDGAMSGYPTTYPQWGPLTDIMGNVYYDYDSDPTEMQAMFADWCNVSDGDIVNVKIIDIASETVIFTTDVEVM